VSWEISRTWKILPSTHNVTKANPNPNPKFNPIFNLNPNPYCCMWE